jgi:hypothetical protein
MERGPEDPFIGLAAWRWKGFCKARMATPQTSPSGTSHLRHQEGRGKKTLKLGTLTALIQKFEALQAIHRSTPPTNHIPNPP